MKHGFEDLKGTAVNFEDSKGFITECFVAEIDPAIGITVAELEDTSVQVICLNKSHWDEDMMNDYNARFILRVEQIEAGFIPWNDGTVAGTGLTCAFE